MIGEEWMMEGKCWAGVYGLMSGWRRVGECGEEWVEGELCGVDDGGSESVVWTSEKRER